MKRRIAKKILRGLANDEFRWRIGSIEKAFLKKPKLPPKECLQASRNYLLLTESDDWEDDIQAHLLLNLTEAIFFDSGPFKDLEQEMSVIDNQSGKSDEEFLKEIKEVKWDDQEITRPRS